MEINGDKVKINTNKSDNIVGTLVMLIYMILCRDSY